MSTNVSTWLTKNVASVMGAVPALKLVVRGCAVIVSLVSITVSVAGCSMSTHDAPTTPVGAARTTIGSTPPNSTGDLTRARTLNVATLDPCAFLTTAQRTSLGATLPAPAPPRVHLQQGSLLRGTAWPARNGILRCGDLYQPATSYGSTNSDQ